MTRPAPLLFVILFTHYVHCENTILSRQLAANSSSTSEKKCTAASECPTSDVCTECEDGYGPLCASAECVNNRCQTIKPCSRKDECTETDLNQCVIPEICARCKEGYGPPCAEAACENGKCTTISPCSSYNPVSSSPTTTLADSTECQNNGDCSYVKQCVKECPNGASPLCAFGTCVKGKCIITYPCSQKTECTEIDLSQCIVPAVCARCKEGYSPGCAEATCENGQCKEIQPCSIYTEPSTTSLPTNDRCTSDSQCPRQKICAVQCANGTTPRCASAKCVDGKCVAIKPCSQHPCKTKATCPYNKLNCARCARGRGPACEQPACSCGLCSIIKPCSKNLLTGVNSVSVIE